MCGIEFHLWQLVPAKHLLILEKDPPSTWVFKCSYAKKKKNNKTWQIISEVRTWTSEMERLVCKANYLQVRRDDTWQSVWLCHCLSITHQVVDKILERSLKFCNQTSLHYILIVSQIGTLTKVSGNTFLEKMEGPPYYI